MQLTCASSNRSFQSHHLSHLSCTPTFTGRSHLYGPYCTTPNVTYISPYPDFIPYLISLPTIPSIPHPQPTSFISLLLQAPAASAPCLCCLLLPTHLSEQGPPPCAVRLGGQNGPFQAESLLVFVSPTFRSSRGNS